MQYLFVDNENNIKRTLKEVIHAKPLTTLKNKGKDMYKNKR